jgi:hypothetical protein
MFSEESFAAIAAFECLLLLDPNLLPAVIRENSALKRTPASLHA